ncbi:hypothetical protein [Luteibacter sp. 9135]|uniref:hypothetical protein n=1 Tax=Luteibacter sp. 9135 TaxID=1500893 RepID=UPI00056A77AA|nr:hypothetical protein [Luteibacter sp. 9135]
MDEFDEEDPSWRPDVDPLLDVPAWPWLDCCDGRLSWAPSLSCGSVFEDAEPLDVEDPLVLCAVATAAAATAQRAKPVRRIFFMLFSC